MFVQANPTPVMHAKQGIQSAESVLNYRYVGNYGRFNGIPPQNFTPRVWITLEKYCEMA
ncbi:Uncharacterised protein [Salmonella bongori]|nr:Uncharacterised protein [Salmonella bongori]